MFIYNKDGIKIGELYDDYLINKEDPKEKTCTLATPKNKMYKIFYGAPQKKVNDFYDVLCEYHDIFKLNGELQENFFLAQIVAEVGNALSLVRENLNYSCNTLKSTFSYYRNNPSEATKDGRCNGHPSNQVNIGNKAYANRLGNGNVSSGDGYRYRGGGFFQLTGKHNYDRMGEVIQQKLNKPIDGKIIVSNITDIHMAVLTALAFWYENKCYECENIDCVTQKVNRYTNSYSKRKKIYQWIALEL